MNPRFSPLLFPRFFEHLYTKHLLCLVVSEIFLYIVNFFIFVLYTLSDCFPVSVQLE